MFLHVELDLKLHPNKISLRKYRQGIDFLGYVVLPHTIIVRTKTKRRILKRVRQKIMDFKCEKITEYEFLQSVSSYFAVLSHAKSYKLKQKIMHLIWETLKSPDH